MLGTNTPDKNEIKDIILNLKSNNTSEKYSIATEVLKYAWHKV